MRNNNTNTNTNLFVDLQCEFGGWVSPPFTKRERLKLKIENMKITNHFRKRTNERTDYYDCESLLYDVNLHKESMIPLTTKSPQLRWYPWLKKELRKFPNSWIMMLECLNLAIITDGLNLITVYKLNVNY